MIFETVKSEGLAHLSYMIGDESAGVCAVIDPRRDVDVYLEIARRERARVEYIIETHINADFVSGSRELSEKCGAPIYVSAVGSYEFPTVSINQGDSLGVGSISLQALHTPGHTPEHICLRISGGDGTKLPWGLFTGDTLFAGEIGRPDLMGDGSEEALAVQLFETLQSKLLLCGKDVIIYPGHGEGSPCGGSIGERETSTIGYEFANNPTLKIKDVGKFVRAVLDLPLAPSYYARVKALNASGPDVVGSLPFVRPLSPSDFKDAMAAPAAVAVDVRDVAAYAGASIGKSVSIPLGKSFPLWAGWLLQPEHRILLVLSDDEDVDCVQRHLFRLGLDTIGGYLQGGVPAWIEAGFPYDSNGHISVHDLNDRMSGDGDSIQIVDVRRQDEWSEGHIPGSRNIYLPFLLESADSLDKSKPTAVYCRSGRRSSTGASILRRHGFDKAFSVPGSMLAWESAGFEVEK